VFFAVGKCSNCKSNLSPAACKNMREVGFMPNSPGGMGEYLILEENYLHRFDDDMSYEKGALIEPFSVSYFAIWGHGGHVDASDEVVVFGAGPIGLFAAITAKVAGARVIVVEPIEYRRQIAKKSGINEVLNPRGEDVKAAILDLTAGRGADLVVEASGTDDAIASCLEVAGHNGRVRLVGHSIGRKVPMEIGMVIWKSLSVTGQAGSPFAFPKTIRFMSVARKMIDYSQMITRRFPLDRVHDAFDFAANEREKAIKVLVTM